MSSTDFPCAVHEGRLPLVEAAGLPARIDRSRARRSRARPHRPSLPGAARMATRCRRAAPAANRAMTASTSGRSSTISSPAVPFPLMKSSSSKGGRSVRSCDPSRGPRPCASTPRNPRGRSWRRADRWRGFSRPGRVHHHDAAPDARLARGERDPLRGVSGTDRPHAVGELLSRQAADRIVGAANLEGPDGLQSLELEEDFRPAGGDDANGHERRADRHLVHGSRGVADRVDRDGSLHGGNRVADVTS